MQQARYLLRCPCRQGQTCSACHHGLTSKFNIPLLSSASFPLPSSQPRPVREPPAQLFSPLPFSHQSRLARSLPTSMASGSMYHNPSFSRWADDTPDLVHDDRSLAFTPAPRGGHHAYPRPPMQPDGFQVWIPPPNAFYDPYDTPQTQPSRPLPILASEAGSPPPLSRRSLINDPAFAVDPHLNPHNWIGNYADSPAQSFTNASATTVLQFPLPRVPSFPASEASTRAAPIPVPASTAPSRPQSYAPDRSAPSTPYEAGHVYLIPPSTAPSASSASSSSGRSTPSSERRSPDRSSRAHDTRQEPIYIAPTDISTPRTRHGNASEAQTERHTRQQPRPPPSYAETVSSSGTDDSSPRVIEEKPRPVVLSYHPPDDSAQPDIPPPPRQPAPSQSQPSSSERPPERTRRKSASRPGAVPLKDLDSIDELDETTPYGIAVHHKGPYEAIAAMLGQRRPLELSPDGAPIELEPVDDDFPASRPGRRHKVRSQHPWVTNATHVNTSSISSHRIAAALVFPPPPVLREPDGSQSQARADFEGFDIPAAIIPARPCTRHIPTRPLHGRATTHQLPVHI
ncbi:hypothetical protein FA95DRAFT_636845 [Auriscalpium vulgare]|uniref:Uncharacterized protein n=1 Tax=Auriscalpium vulgare TaxID=40419 RepID=A0ACB8RCV6_9AGAM|nr:hypothetical protein FA95DRAFT_636845 [Auriscalpium vulgare]